MVVGGGEWCWLFSAATAVGNGNCGDSVMVMVSQWWWLGEQWRSNRVVDTCYSGYITDIIIAPKIQPSQDPICLTLPGLTRLKYNYIKIKAGLSKSRNTPGWKLLSGY